jgi:integrase
VQVYALPCAVPARFRALVLVAAFSGLCWGDLAALRRYALDLAAGVVRVPRKLAALKNRLEFGPPKSEAGGRSVALSRAAAEAIRPHLDEFVEAELPEGFHLHDLGHTGTTIAAASGASTRELMHRMGHASMRAALIYQHATSELTGRSRRVWDRRIAKATADPVKKAAGKKARRKKKERQPGDGPSQATGP